MMPASDHTYARIAAKERRIRRLRLAWRRMAWNFDDAANRRGKAALSRPGVERHSARRLSWCQIARNYHDAVCRCNKAVHTSRYGARRRSRRYPFRQCKATARRLSRPRRSSIQDSQLLAETVVTAVLGAMILVAYWAALGSRGVW